MTAQPLTVPARPDPLVIAIPIHDDWEAVAQILVAIDATLTAAGIAARILLVDDGSSEAAPLTLAAPPYRSIAEIAVLELRRNLGHQRAIAIALAYLCDRERPETVVVMDGDGEDAPADIPRLLARLRETGSTKIVFAERQRRAEGVVFRAFYALYRWAHLVLTGSPVRVGNFSAIPAGQLRRLAVVSELWYHYAAAVFKARLPNDSVPTERARRVAGHTKMSFVALVAHGLSALFVHSEIIGVRLLVSSVAAAIVFAAAAGFIAAARAFSDAAITIWTTGTMGLVLIGLAQAILFAVVFVFLGLHARSQPMFVPIRDYAYFVNDRQTLLAAAASPTSVDERAPREIDRLDPA